MTVEYAVEAMNEGKLAMSTVVWMLVDGQKAQLVARFYEPNSLLNASRYAQSMERIQVAQVASVG